MNIWVGADHRGKEYKTLIKDYLTEKGHKVKDVGTSPECSSVDYPDYAIPVAGAVANGTADRGVLVCASGIGMSISANRLKRVRAALCLTPGMAETARRHNNCNVLCLGQDLIEPHQVLPILNTWLDTKFEGGRHIKRLKKIDNLKEV